MALKNDESICESNKEFALLRIFGYLVHKFTIGMVTEDFIMSCSFGLDVLNCGG